MGVLWVLELRGVLEVYCSAVFLSSRYISTTLKYKQVSLYIAVALKL